MIERERSSFSEEKEPKRLLLLGAVVRQNPRPKVIKVFLGGRLAFFFSKKNILE
jgi:hypothetical protein